MAASFNYIAYLNQAHGHAPVQQATSNVPIQPAATSNVSSAVSSQQAQESIDLYLKVLSPGNNLKLLLFVD